jgi:hypothetical protein
VTETIRLPDGRPLFLSIDDFIEAMESRESCFLCLRAMDAVGVTREHVIPRWILKQYGLFDQTVTIGDETQLAYRKHTVPCCPTCNAFLGRQIEQPIRDRLLEWPRRLKDDFRDFEFLEKLYCWLSLLHFKSLYKDVFITRYDEENRKQFRLGEGRDWFIHHHVNSLCRLAFPELSIDPQALGSMLFFVLPEDGSEPFDFITFHDASTMMVRVGQVAVIAALNDSCGALSIFNDNMGQSMPKRPLDILDAREVLGHITLINQYLEERPQYRTLSDHTAMRARISATLPSNGARCTFDPSDPEHLEQRRLVWNLLFRTYQSQMTSEQLSYLDAGTLSPLGRI